MTADISARLDRLSPAQRALFERMRGKRPDPAAAPETAPETAPGTAPGAAPLSFAQARLWFLDRLQPESPAYNIASAVEIGGGIDPAALDAALQQVIARHGVLRTRYEEGADGPRQIVDPAPAGPVLRLADAPDAAAAAALATAEARRPFDLATGPVFRLLLIRMAPTRHVLAVTVHHIAADAWSLGILFDELMAAYRARLDGLPADLPVLTTSYAAYAAEQRAALDAAAEARLLDWWRHRLDGLPVLDWPAGPPRPPVQRFEGAARRFDVPAALTVAVEALGRHHGASTFQTLMAAAQVLIHHETGQRDFALGAPVANRRRREHEALIGFFVNTLPFRARFDDDPAFTTWLERLRDDARAVLAHQDLPFEKLVEALEDTRDPSRNPLVQVVLAFQNAPVGSGTAPGGLSLRGLETDQGIARFDLEIHLTRAPGGGLAGMILYDTALFDAARVDRLGRRFVRLLEMVAADPGRRVGDLVPLLDEDLAAIAAAAPAVPPAAELVPVRLARMVAARAAAPAVEDLGGGIDYAGLDAAAARLMQALARSEIGRGDVVAVILSPGRATAAAAMGIWAAGAAYLPLDPRHPPARLAALIRRAGARAVVAPALPEGVELLPRLDVDFGPDNGGCGNGGAAARAARINTAEDAAYLIFTSGSTGEPKGVVVPHGALAGLVDWHVNAFGTGPATRASLVAGPGFDAAVWEIWPVLAAGGTAVAADPAMLADPAALAGWLVDRRITQAFMPTPLVGGLLGRAWPAETALRLMLAGGERLSLRPPQGLPFRLVNNYGPTEAAVVATSGTVSPGAAGMGLPDIGGAIIGARLHVLNAAGRPVGIDMPGELHVGGRGLARGYAGDPVRTALAFRPDATGNGARLYATGDLVVLRADGRLDFLGRADDQVKLRGHRIEPGEIAAAIRALDGVQDAAVILREDGAEPRLCAYVVATTTPARLARRLRDRLPGYMLPADWVQLDRLPLTTSGKLDRRALPAPEMAATTGAVAETAAERLIADIWAEVLGRKLPPGRDDDFFALGGHSLAAARVAARLQAAGRPLPLATLFRATTLAALAAELDMAAAPDDDGEVDLPEFAPVLAGEVPLSPGQARWWFLDRLGADPAAAVISAALDLAGPLDVDRLAAAFGQIVARHLPLRTAILAVDEQPRAVPQPVPAPWPLPVLPVADEAAAGRLARELAAQPFDLASGPFLRTHLLQFSAERHRLIVVLHHVAADGWSMGVLIRELQDLYAGRIPAPLSVDYPATARRGAALTGRDLAFWRDRLAGLPPPQAVPGRPERETVTEAADPVVVVALPAAATGGLEAQARRAGVTPFMMLLTAAQILFARLWGTRDFALGTPVANRPDPASEALIGFLVNTVVLRSSLVQADDRLDRLLAQVKADTVAALAHQALPFDRLVEALDVARSGTDNPLFRVLVAWQPGDLATPDLAGLEVTPRPSPLIGTRLDLEIHGQAGPGGWHLALTYAPARLARADATAIGTRLARVLTAMAAGPEQRWTALPILDDDEAARIDAAARGRAMIHPRVLDEIMARAAEDPAAPALIDGRGSIDRANLIGRAAALARLLPEAHGRSVGLMLGRGRAHGVGLLGVWLAGAAAMPLDPDLPDARLKTMIDIGRPAAIIADPAQLARLRALTDLPVMVLPEGEAKPAPVTAMPDDPAYLLFTSGSTGTPKGVMVAWRTLDQLTGWHRARHPVPAPTLGFAPLGFDVSMQEAALAWAEGSPLVVADETVRRDPAALTAFIRAHQVARLFLPVVMLHALADHLAAHPERIPTSVALIATAGEQLRITAPVRDWCRQSPFAIDNQYGPTESHVVAAELLPADAVDDWPDRPAIGRPVDGAVLFVTDPEGRVLPDEVAGELLIGGTAPAIGYAGDPVRTAERFVTGPDGSLVYRTGDRVIRGRDGRLTYLGRADDQVKIRGFRVEPGEIEAALGAHDEVAQVLVTVRGTAGAATLVAHVEPRVMPADAAGFAGRLAAWLQARLPAPMVPARWVISPALPRSANGKLDRKALPAVDGIPPGQSVGAAPATETETALAGIWTAILGVETVSRGDDFFALGGHSLRATQLVARIERELGIRVQLATVFEQPTLQGLAAAVDEARTDALADDLALLDEDELAALLGDDDLGALLGDDDLSALAGDDDPETAA
ncbi:non-ribosomal peptide synthetase [Tistrella mobilis]|uniref:Carrier domain-containing protein n=1 Tax=Tistrella mobilis TaxID=171437 RepID=A0A161R6F7_9PROT|nr:non-ribosomal peptide synthetase [Tistrella mobilis]KYO55374.1 hypothetical protein AUP44_23660 [Tistrella mobilis]